MNNSFTKKPTNPKTQKPSAVCKQILVNSAKQRAFVKTACSHHVPEPLAREADSTFLVRLCTPLDEAYAVLHEASQWFCDVVEAIGALHVYTVTCVCELDLPTGKSYAIKVSEAHWLILRYSKLWARNA